MLFSCLELIYCIIALTGEKNTHTLNSTFVCSVIHNGLQQQAALMYDFFLTDGNPKRNCFSAWGQIRDLLLVQSSILRTHLS